MPWARRRPAKIRVGTGLRRIRADPPPRQGDSPYFQGMKNWLPLLALWLLSISVVAQNFPVAPHATPQNADDTILLTLPNGGEAAWHRAAQVLVARGYTLAYSDAQLLTLNTDFTDIHGTSGYLSVFVFISGNQLTLRARSNATPIPNASFGIVRRGALLGVSRDWQELEAIARDLGGTAGYVNTPAR